MRIIHYIDRLKAGDLLSDSILRLTTAEKEYADVLTVTRNDDFKKIISKEKPDVVHIHACWDYQASLRTRWALSTGTAVVLSPHWGLEERIRTKEQKIRKFMKSMIYQYKMVHKVDAIMVSTEREKQTINRLGWKKRIDVVPESILNSQFSDDDMAKNAVAFYKKVLDTRYQSAMGSMEQDAIPALLHVGLTQESIHNILPSDQLLNLRSLKPEQWRRILLYADDEGIRDIIDRGIEMMQLNAPNIDTERIQRYALMAPKETKAIEDKKLVGRRPLTKQRLNDNTKREEKLIRQIAIMIANIQQVQKKRMLSLRHLADLYTIIKYNDYDEDRLADVLRHMRIHSFARRIIQLLADKLRLEEGYMPIKPLNDRTTRHIIRQNFTQRH